MTEVVGAIILDAAGRVLLAQRPPGKKLAGFWEFPGGKVELGESCEAALSRELDEELGLRVEIVEPVGVFPHTYDWGSIRLHVFLVRPLNEPTCTLDVQVFRWLRPESIVPGELAAADREPLAAFMKSGPRAR